MRRPQCSGATTKPFTTEVTKETRRKNKLTAESAEKKGELVPGDLVFFQAIDSPLLSVIIVFVEAKIRVHSREFVAKRGLEH